MDDLFWLRCRAATPALCVYLPSRADLFWIWESAHHYMSEAVEHDEVTEKTANWNTWVDLDNVRV